MKNNLRQIRTKYKIKAVTFAAELGTSVQQLSRLEKGERGMDLDWISRIAKAFHSLGFKDFNAASLIADIPYGQPAKAKGGMAEATKTAQTAKIPVWGVIDADKNEKYALNTEDTPIDWIDPLPSQHFDRDACAFILADETMLPKYAPGETVCFNSRKPAVKGRACAIELTTGGAYFKYYVGSDGENMVFEQTNPPRKIRIKKKLIKRILPLVGMLP